jgi:hypothetical protein
MECPELEEKGVIQKLMTWLRHVALAGLILATLAGCGEGYVLEPARLNVIGMTDDLREQQLLDLVSSFLRQEGFEDFGRYDEMIALVQQDHAMSKKVKEEELARLNRERTFLSDPHHLRIVWADYSNATPRRLRCCHTRPPPCISLRLMSTKSALVDLAPTDIASTVYF